MLASFRSFGIGYFTDGKGILMLQSIQSCFNFAASKSQQMAPLVALFF